MLKVSMKPLFMLFTLGLMELASASTGLPSLLQRARLFAGGQPVADTRPHPVIQNPNQNQAQLRHQAELLRLGASTMLPVHQAMQFQLQPPTGRNMQAGFEAQAAAYLRPRVSQDFRPVGSLGAWPTPARLHQSQSQLVDKIEQHVEHQIEQALEPAPAAKSNGHGERMAAASGEPEEQEEQAEQAPGESGAEHKRKSDENHEQEHKQEHEQPPEAFEIHHHKGGKSFQYFHQGH